MTSKFKRQFVLSVRDPIYSLSGMAPNTSCEKIQATSASSARSDRTRATRVSQLLIFRYSCSQWRAPRLIEPYLSGSWMYTTMLFCAQPLCVPSYVSISSSICRVRCGSIHFLRGGIGGMRSRRASFARMLAATVASDSARIPGRERLCGNTEDPPSIYACTGYNVDITSRDPTSSRSEADLIDRRRLVTSRVKVPFALASNILYIQLIERNRFVIIGWQNRMKFP